MRTINIYKKSGSFAENKDIARDLRIKKLIPFLEKGENVTLDFKGVESMTQSFAHAFLSDVIRKFGPEILDKIAFKNCNNIVKGIIRIVVDYMQI